MSTMAELAWDADGLGPADRLVLVAAATLYDQTGRVPRTRLAAMTCLPRGSVEAVMENLRDRGLLNYGNREPVLKVIESGADTTSVADPAASRNPTTRR